MRPMKQISLLTIVLIALLLPAGCKAEQAHPFHPADTLDALAQASCFSQQLEELDSVSLYRYYRLEEFSVAESDLLASAARRAGGSSCEEAAVLVFSTQEAAEAAQQALSEHVLLQISANRDYRPAEIPKLEQALITLRGNSILLVVAGDSAKAFEAVQALN